MTAAMAAYGDRFHASYEMRSLSMRSFRSRQCCYHMVCSVGAAPAVWEVSWQAVDHTLT